MTDREAFEQWELADIGTEYSTSSDKAWEAWQAALAYRSEQASQAQGTPSSRWAAEGQPDPHGDTYNCERAELLLGDMTDDELANAAYLNYDHRPSIDAILSGAAYMPITYMTAVKERIRWLSRRLVEQASQGQWIPTSERTPEYRQDVALFTIRNDKFIGMLHEGGDWWLSDSEKWLHSSQVTHWMPLPAAPLPHKEGE